MTSGFLGNKRFGKLPLFPKDLLVFTCVKASTEQLIETDPPTGANNSTSVLSHPGPAPGPRGATGATGGHGGLSPELEKHFKKQTSVI